MKTIVLLMFATLAVPAFAGTAVLGGDATMTAATGANLAQNTDAYAQFVSSGGASAILDWSKFNVGTGKEMNFSGAGTTFFNLVDAAASKSQIDGIISGNGSVWVVNPNGIAFGASSQVNVGGLFAAAAGNISNADDLRSGAATMPTFSSFGGSVTAADGSKFTASQVALLGKTVSAAGEFNDADNLAIGAASSLVVDEVAGGKITINLASFVEKTDEELDLGSLTLAGDMRAVTDGKLNINGDVTAGSVYFKAGGEMDVKGDVTANSGNLQLLTQDGDITVRGGVKVTAHGDGATLQVQAGQNEMTLDENYNIVFSTGNVTIDGNLKTDGANGTVTVVGGFNGFGDVKVNGSVNSSGDVGIFTENGVVSVAQDAAVKSIGDGAKVRIYTGLTEYNLGGDIDIAGRVEATGEGARIDIESAYNYFTDGGVAVSGTVAAKGNGGVVSISSGNGYGIDPGNTKISGNVEADMVLLSAYDKDVVIEDGATVTAGIGALIDGSEGVVSEGAIDVGSGVVSVNGNGGDVSISGVVKASGASFKAAGAIDVQNPNNNINMVSAAEGKSVVVMNGGQISVSKATATGGNVSIGTLTGGINVSGEVKTLSDGGSVTLVSAMADGENGDILVGGSGSILAEQGEGAVYLLAGYGENASGNAYVLGEVKSAGTTHVKASNGSIMVMAAGDVASKAGSAFLTASEGVAVGGGVSSATSIKIDGGNGQAIIVDGAKVSSDSGSVFVSADGTVSIGGEIDTADAISATSRGDSVSMASTAELNAANVIAINGAKDVKSAGSIDVSDGKLIASAKDGDLDLNHDGTGRVKAGDASLQASGLVIADNPQNEFSGKVSASGRIVQIAEASGDMNLGDMTVAEALVVDVGDHDIVVSGDVEAQDVVGLYGGNITVEKDGSVTATGDGSVVELGASGELSVSGSLSADIVSLQSVGSVVVGRKAQINATGYTPIDLGNGTSYNKAIDIMSYGDVEIANGAQVKALDAQGDILITASNVRMGGSVSAGRDLTVSASGNLTVVGAASAGDTAIVAADTGIVQVDGNVNASKMALVESLKSDAVINGLVHSDHTAIVSADRGGASINGRVEGGENSAVFAGRAGIDIDGSVVAGGNGGLAFLSSGGNVSFSPRGVLDGIDGAAVYAKGNLTQADGNLPYKEGRMDAVSLRPAVSGKEVTLHVGGAIGGGASSPFVVDGKVYAVSFGDMYLAAGHGRSLEGGNASSVAAAKETAQFTIDSARKTLDGTLSMEEMMARLANPSDFDDNAIMYAAGDMYLYTAGQLDANSYVGSGGNMTVSAAKFGDMSYLDAGGLLTINNVGGAGTPQITYFESVNGVEPKINNQPNDTVIFIDGRLAGGNLKILNQFGANEAFLVETPELKSIQGIFGSPTFLHSDLDVANPMEVGMIDYLLQETPRLTLDKDFPKEADQHVDSVVIPERDSIQFGRGTAKAESAPPSMPDGRVVMVR